MLVLRHASAGERLSSAVADRVRTLDRRGRADSRRLPGALVDYAIDRIVTSPHTRCVETVGPIARARGLEVEHMEELTPDASRRDVLALLAELPSTTLVCTHREVIERLFSGQVSCEKSGAWLVERRSRRWAPTVYLSPPATPARDRRTAALV